MERAPKEIKDFFKLLNKGGEGSGNFGHSGRPGEVGGSGDGGGGGNSHSKKDRKRFRDAWKTSLENATGSTDHTPYGNMDEEETMAVRLYSTNASTTLNNSLRGGKESEDIRVWKEMMDTGLDKLPDSPGVVYRGVNVPRDFDGDAKDFAESFKVGSTVSDKGFLSASGSFNVATDFIEKENSGVVFSMKSKSGKEIQEVSWAPTENETVFARNTKFTVTRISKNDNKWAPYTVHLTEQVKKDAEDMSETFMQLLEDSESAFRASVSE